MRHLLLPLLLRMSVKGGDLIVFENTVWDRNLFESKIDCASISGSIRAMMTEDCIFWYLQLELSRATTFHVSCPAVKTPTIICSLLDAIEYRQVGIPTETMVGQQFNFLHIPKLDCDLVMKKGEYGVFGASYSASFLEQHAPACQILWEFMEHVSAQKAVILNVKPLATTGSIRGVIEDVIYNDLATYNRDWFLRARSLDLLRLVIERVTPDTLEFPSRMKNTDVTTIHEIHSFIVRTIDQPHSLHSLAMRAGINMSKLQTAFRELYGTSVMAFIRHEKLLRAKKQLENSRMDIKSIAKRAGYTRLSAFTAAFSSTFKIAPAHLRKGIIR